MALKFEVRGERKLFDLADALREAGRKDLSAQLNRGVREAAREVGAEIERSTDTYMPRGFEARFAQSLIIEYQARLARGRRVTVIGYARGARGNRRDVEAMEAGTLRHPVYGRTRRGRRGRIRNPWVVQQIRPGWFTEPAARVRKRAAAKVDAAVKRVAAKIERSI